MIAKDLRQKNLKELAKMIDDLKAELFMLRFKNSTGQLDQPHKINLVRKDIARVFTVINEKNIFNQKESKVLQKQKPQPETKELKNNEKKVENQKKEGK